ncbi:MAG: PRC-barrel domain-containing protein [Vicinamibacterales bacterium]
MMDSSATPQQTSSPTEHGTHQVDPRSYLRPELRVIGEQGKALGKVDTLVHDSSTGTVSAIVVRHGLLRRDQTIVPADQVKHVNHDSVILRYSATAFKKLPKMADRS